MSEAIVQLKRCCTCKQPKPTTEFRRHRSTKDGFDRHCKDCRKKWDANLRRSQKHQDYMRDWRSRNQGRLNEASSRWYERNKDTLAVRARQAVNNAIAAGTLVRARNLLCDCGSQAEEYHHHKGYEPENHLVVTPICVTCHRNLHAKAGLKNCPIARSEPSRGK
jgi:hypothetical protein